MVKKLTKNVKNDKTMDYCDVSRHVSSILHYTYILKSFQLPYNEDLLILICENSSSYMNKVKPFLGVEIAASEKSADISKICDNFFFFFGHVPKAN